MFNVRCGCLDRVRRVLVLCDAPEESTYLCNPLPAGSPGCVGGPLRDAPEQIFPGKCVAEIPSCDSDDGVRSFSCYELMPSMFIWGEHL